jgi:hypothetical protein
MRVAIYRRALLQLAGLAGLGGIIYFVGGNYFFKPYLLNKDQDNIYLKDFSKNSKTGVLHHSIACRVNQ